MLNHDKECPICFDEINIDEGFIIPECCNNPVHLKCIINWYKKNNKSNICFICQQVNNFSKDIHLNVSEKQIVLREDLSENNSEEYSEEYNKSIKLGICITILGTISVFIILVIFL
jgi:hypothetical protein